MNNDDGLKIKFIVLWRYCLIWTYDICEKCVVDNDYKYVFDKTYT